jgi:predicted secreted hydrolase
MNADILRGATSEGTVAGGRRAVASRSVLVPLLAALAGPALGQGLYGLEAQVDGFAVPQRGVPFEFPRDHGAHPEYRIEWWYLTANLEGEDGRDYGVQWTLFRTALAPGDAPQRDADGTADARQAVDASGADGPRDPGPEGGLAGWRTPQLWMGHMGITTPEAHFHAERLARGGTGQAGVDAEPFRAWIDEWAMEGPTPAEVRLTASGDAAAYDLSLTAHGPFVPQGDDGYSVKSTTGQASYYYSQPFYEVSGTLTLPEGDVTVTGTGWMDREWSSQFLAEGQSGWDWFSLSFDTGERMMVFRLRDEERGHHVPGTWIAADGTPAPFDHGAATLTPLEEVRVAGRDVPVRWRIEMPERGLDVTTEPVNPQSWMGTSFPYWEGAIRISGTHPGRGYLEMTGYRPEDAPGG